MELPTISCEQQSIIDNISTNKNVIVESVAGSGKTTSNIYIAKSFPTSSILLLTYNAKLKIETRQKIANLGIKNLETHSYHSFCVKYYNHKCFTDYQIIKIVKNNSFPLTKFSYDIIILDEAQDISPLYHQLICKIYSENMVNKPAQICLLGDRYQSIYDFNRADARFIIYADILFNLNSYSWVRTNLSTSYRITNEMADFINKCMLKQNRINAQKTYKSKPTYLICNVYNDSQFSYPFKMVKAYLKQGYKPEEIFVLAPSVRNEKSPVRQLENLIKLHLKNVPVYVPVSDEEKLDEEILKNKMVFSTFHQAKGLERKAVLVFNFDDSYFKFYKKEKNQKICPNELYVAGTRALNDIVFIHHYRNNYLPFVNVLNIKPCCNVLIEHEIDVERKYECKIHEVSATDLIKHLPIDVMNNLIEYFEVETIKEKSDFIKIPMKMEQSQGYESVGEITGVAIPAYLELLTSGKMTIYSQALYRYKTNSTNHTIDNNSVDFIDSDEKPKETYDLTKIKVDSIKPDELLFVSNYYCSDKSGFLYKIYQIDNYNWLSKDNLTLAIDRLKSIGISKKAIYEHYVELENKHDKFPELIDRRLIGYIDCIDNNNVYEFKCVTKLENEHYIQLCVYMYLNECTIRSKQKNPKQTYNKQSSLSDDLYSLLSSLNTKLSMTRDIDEISQINKMKESVLTKLSTIDNKKEETTQIIKVDDSDDKLKYNYYLYNILSDEQYKIKITYTKLRQMIKYLIQAKYLNQTEVSDDIFIKQNQEYLQKYIDIIRENINDCEVITEKKELDTENFIEIDNKKYILLSNKIYNIKKDGSKGKKYGYIENDKIIKTISKTTTKSISV